MKITKFISTLAIALAAASAFTACMGQKENEYTISQSYLGFFNEIIDPQSGDIDLYPGVSYTVDWNLTSSTATIQLVGIKLPDGTSYPTLRINEAPFTITARGWNEVKLSDYTPEGVGSFIQAPKIKSFLFQSVNRYINGVYLPVTNAVMTLENGYIVYSLPTQIIEVGETNVTNKADGSVFTQTASDSGAAIYRIQLDPVKETAAIIIEGAKFAKDMPAMNMKFSGVPFHTTTTGEIVMEKDELIPSLLTGTTVTSATETPMPAFPISGLKITYVPDQGIWVNFVCTMKSDKISGEYSVSMVNKYPASVYN